MVNIGIINKVKWLAFLLGLLSLAINAWGDEKTSSSPNLTSLYLTTHIDKNLHSNHYRYSYKPTPSDNQPSKQRGGEFLQSLLIPGLGQYLAGQETKAYIFFSTEAVLILGVLGSRLYAGWLEEDYQQFAKQHAGVSSPHNHQYYVDIGNWMNQMDYNEQRLRDRDFDRLYTSSEDTWQWDSDANRAKFKSIRLQSDRLYNQALMFVGGLLLNHLFSAIDASSSKPKSSKLLFTSSPDTKGLNLKIHLIFK